MQSIFIDIYMLLGSTVHLEVGISIIILLLLSRFYNLWKLKQKECCDLADFTKRGFLTSDFLAPRPVALELTLRAGDVAQW